MSLAGRQYVHRPGTVFSAAALVFAGIAAVMASLSSILSLGISVIGIGGLIIGLTVDDQRVAIFGSFSLLAGVLAAGVMGARPETLLPSITAALLAWEFRVGAFSVSGELSGGTVERLELLHVVTATTVSALITGVVYALYRTLTVGVSVLSVILLVIAVLALGLALRD